MARAVRFIALLVFGSSLSSAAFAQTATKIVDHGNDAQRLVFVVMGDGYSGTPADQAKFHADVDTLIVNGVLANDFYKSNSGAFNVYRVDLVSMSSGVSTPTRARNTALNTIYNGVQNDCWISENADTEQRVVDAAQSVTKIDYFVVIPNTTAYGGCSRGNILYITSGSPFTVASHEYGHGIGQLYDEYGTGEGDTFTGTFNDLNCSSFANRTTIRWAGKVAPSTPVPTTFAAGMQENSTVGAFQGCNYFDFGLYRPVQTCRMKAIDHVFCPVCLDLMSAAVRPYLPPKPAPAAPSNLRIQATRSQPFARPVALFQTPPANAEPSYVSLVLQVLNDGRVQILHAAEGRGDVVRSNATADSLYEVTQNNRVVAAGPLPPGWLNEHSYGPPGRETAHVNRPAKSSTVSITIPRTTLNALLAGNTSISLNQVKPGVRLQPITPDWVTSLKANAQLTTRASLSAQNVAVLLRQLQTNRGR